MRLFLVVFAAAAFLAAGNTAVLAQGEFPLKYVVGEENEPLTSSGLSYSGGRAKQPPDIKALPQGISDNRRYFVVPVGNRRLWAVLDMSSPPKLYVDAAGTSVGRGIVDLSAVAPLVGKVNGSQCTFGPINVPLGDEKKAVIAKVLFVSEANNQILGGRAAGYMAGEAKLGGQTYRVAVLDKNLNGRCESAFGADGQREPAWRADAIAIDLDQNGLFSRGGDGSEIMPLVKAVRVKDVYYHVQVALDGSSIKFEKYEPKMGTLDIGIAASLTALSDTGMHNLSSSDGKWQVPEGKYSGESLSISKTDADGKEWRLGDLDVGPLGNFEVRGGQATAIKVGPPLALKVDAGQPESGQIPLNLTLAGKGGETYSVGLLKGTSRLPPPKVKVLDAAGKVLAEGNSEFG
ncbi:MAG: hypothetical protein NTX87_19945 [Planctomycetota bacterium]|nr:hypothetical protein [Planctomycetota bacterium]